MNFDTSSALDFFIKGIGLFAGIGVFVWVVTNASKFNTVVQTFSGVATSVASLP